jgi:hypothetical protein
MNEQCWVASSPTVRPHRNGSLLRSVAHLAEPASAAGARMGGHHDHGRCGGAGGGRDTSVLSGPNGRRVNQRWNGDMAGKLGSGGALRRHRSTVRRRRGSVATTLVIGEASLRGGEQ